jgi:beta-lactamase regulating signal transducer with metallopeptidase domain
MNMLHLLSASIVQAIMQSLLVGAVCYASLLLVLRLFPRFSSQGKYLLCDATLLLIAVAFLEPFVSAFDRYNSAPSNTAFRETGAHQVVHGTAPSASSMAAIDSTPQHSLSSLPQTVVDFIGQYSAAILQLYLIGLFLFSLRLVGGYWVTVRLRRTGLLPPDELWQQQMNKVCNVLKLRRPVRLAFSPLVKVPCIIGWAKAVVLIPVSLVSRLSPDQVEAVLMHELAHYRQYHYYINLGAQLAVTFQFFNPFVWLIQMHGSRYREYASDAIAIKHSLQIALAESLLIIAEQGRSYNPLSLRLGGSKKGLSRRIQNLLQIK